MARKKLHEALDDVLQAIALAQRTNDERMENYYHQQAACMALYVIATALAHLEIELDDRPTPN